MTFNPDFFPWETEEQNDNCLMQYLQQQHPILRYKLPPTARIWLIFSLQR